MYNGIEGLYWQTYSCKYIIYNLGYTYWLFYLFILTLGWNMSTQDDSALLAQIHNQNRSYRFSYGISTEAGEEKTGLRIFVTKKMTAWHPFLTLK